MTYFPPWTEGLSNRCRNIIQNEQFKDLNELREAIACGKFSPGSIRNLGMKCYTDILAWSELVTKPIPDKCAFERWARRNDIEEDWSWIRAAWAEGFKYALRQLTFIDDGSGRSVRPYQKKK